MPRLHEAAASGDIEKVKQYLELGDDINDMSHTVSSKGTIEIQEGSFGCEMTPLHLAVYNGHTQVVHLLIAAGAQLNQKKGWGRQPIDETALDIAISTKNIALAKILKAAGAADENNLLDKALSNRKIEEELYQASTRNKPDIIRAIFTEGLLTKNTGEKMLRYAVKYNHLPVVTVLVLECGISVNACSIDSLTSFNQDEFETPLGLAAEYGHDAIAQFLLENGAEVDKYTHASPFLKDCTPLIKAILYVGRPANPQLIKILLDFGADVKKISAHTIDCIANKNVAVELAILLEHGFNPDLAYHDTSFLEQCFKNSQYSMALQMIQYGADISGIDNNGMSYLHKSRDIALTKYLVAKGLDIELNDAHGKTPIEYVDQKSAEFLASQGARINKLSLLDHRVLSSCRLTEQLINEQIADLNITNNEGRTPLCELARGAHLPGYLDTLRLILHSGLCFDLNQQGKIGGWTALHHAFSQNTGHVNIGSLADTKESVANSNHTKAINLLIASGAKPLKDKAGRTPLMCMTFSKFSDDFNDVVIDSYSQFEAEYYRISLSSYQHELMKLRKFGSDFASKSYNLSFLTPKIRPIDAFWQAIDKQRDMKDQLDNAKDFSFI